MSYTQEQSVGLKTWILLNEDLTTPYMVDVGGNNKFETNNVMYVIVKAKNRAEAKKFMRWTHESLRSKTIIDPMVIEVTELTFKPAKIEY